MKKINDTYFLTMENLGEYLSEDNEDLSDSQLEERVKLNFSLFKKNDNLEKKALLLNNCLLNFKLFKGDIKADLIFPVYYELIKLEPLDDLLEEQELANTLYEKFNSFSSDEKNKYIGQLMEALYIVANALFNKEEYDAFGDLMGKINKLYKENETNDFANFNYVKSITLIGSLMFMSKRYSDAYSIYLKSYEIISSIKENIDEKLDVLAVITFSLGNILFQADATKEAQSYFQDTITLCLNNKFKSKFNIMHLAYNYLSQVQVYVKEYDEAISTIKEYLEVSKTLYSGDEYLSICGEFYFRIGVIYRNYKNDSKSCIENIFTAKDILSKISNKNEKVSKLLENIDDCLMELVN